jgi:hypothetical protein
MQAPECPELARFLRGEIDAHHFPHREHVRMAFETLRRHDFTTSAQLYSKALRLMTARAGGPEVFNQTVTIAFLSLVSERMELGGVGDFGAFEQHHPELLDRDLLGRWYTAARLKSQLARRTFLLPDCLNGAGCG